MQANPIILSNRYQLIQQLSHKATRQTFLAHDLETNTQVIAKILQFNQASQWEEFKLFEREVKTLKNLNHSAIPQYLDSFELEENNTHSFVLIQTYIDAPSLESLIEGGGKFTEEKIKQLAEGILKILVYLHEQNPPVIHRDIKPSNILLNNRSGNSIGDIYLVDFGALQTVMSKESGTITIVGSCGYIPLEQFSGKTIPASDLYSLGMTLIYLLTGIHPADLTQENGQVKFSNYNISRLFTRWLEKMTHPYLDKRFASARISLGTLNSDEMSEGYHLNLRPKDSKVILNCDGDKLEIITTEVKYPFGETVSSGNIEWIIIITVITMVFFPNLFGLVGWTFLTVMFLAQCINMGLVSIKFNSKKLTSIDKNNNLIGESRYRKLKNKTQWEKMALVENINLIAYNPGYEFDRFLDSTGKQHQRGTVTVPPSLSVYAGMVEFKIGDELLSQAEYWWLAQELSDFLGLEVKIIYPTPEVPPEQSNCAGCGC